MKIIFNLPKTSEEIQMTHTEKLKVARIAEKIDAVWFKMEDKEKADFKTWWSEQSKQHGAAFRQIWYNHTTIAAIRRMET